MRIVIADDHCYYRRALGRMLRASGIDVVAEVADGEAALRAVAVTEPDVVLMDLYMPRLSGADATKLIARQSPGVPVVMLSVFADEPEIVDAVLAGACGSVLKGSPVEDLLAAIQSAAAGRPLVSPSVATALLQRFRDKTRGDVRRPVPAQP